MTMRYNAADDTPLYRATGADAGKPMGEPCCSNKNDCIPPLRCNYTVTLSDLVGTLAEWNGAHVVAWRASDEDWFLFLRTGMFPVWMRLRWTTGGGIWPAEWSVWLVENNESGGGQASCTWTNFDAGECAPTGAYPFYYCDPEGNEDSTAVVS
jgi:hypothetical protein